MQKTLAVFVVAITVGYGTQWVVRQAIGFFGQGSLLSGLPEVAATLNEQMPMMVDEETELMSVVADGSTLTYNARFVNVGNEVSNRDLEAALDTIRPNATKNVCSMPDADKLFAEGLRLRYAYYRRDNTFIETFYITAQDCGF